MTNENTIVFEYDRVKDEIKEAVIVIDWKRQHGLPKNVFAMSTRISRRAKWLMDTGCGHDLIGRAKAKSLGVDITQGDGEIVFIHIRRFCGRVGRDHMCWMRRPRYFR